jgi:hypothetical protein
MKVDYVRVYSGFVANPEPASASIVFPTLAIFSLALRRRRA